MEYRVNCPICEIWGEVVPSGNDCTITINGGTPHIGCVALAVPRPSLTGIGSSATVSIINRTGHMDDVVATAVAKRIASERKCTVACTCGIHIDGASPGTITQIKDSIPTIVKNVLALIERKECADPDKAN